METIPGVMICSSVWGSRMALLVIDPQRKFTINVPDWDNRMTTAVSGINSFARMFRERGLPVIFIFFDGESHTGYHGEDSDEWLPGIETSDTDIIVHKKHMNCFKETVLEEVLRENGVDCALLTGMLSEFCVISTYFAAAERGVFPYLGRGALIPYNEKGNEAVELICSMLEEDVLGRFLSGEQPPLELVE